MSASARTRSMPGCKSAQGRCCMVGVYTERREIGRSFTSVRRRRHHSAQRPPLSRARQRCRESLADFILLTVVEIRPAVSTAFYSQEQQYFASILQTTNVLLRHPFSRISRSPRCFFLTNLDTVWKTGVPKAV